MFRLFAHHVERDGSLVDSLNIFRLTPSTPLDHCLAIVLYGLFYGALVFGVVTGLRFLARRGRAMLAGPERPEAEPQAMSG